jgi:hypothetical protein
MGALLLLFCVNLPPEKYRIQSRCRIRRDFHPRWVEHRTVGGVEVLREGVLGLPRIEAMGEQPLPHDAVSAVLA